MATPRTVHEQMEHDKRTYERKQIELLEQNLAYQNAVRLHMGGTLDTWHFEEFDPKDKKSDNDLGAILAGANSSQKIEEGVYTREKEGVTKSIIFEGGSLRPHGAEWKTTFDENGWREVVLFAKEKLGSDTLTFDFQNIGTSKRTILGGEGDPTRKLAIKQLEGMIRLAKEQNVALELGPKAKELLADMANDDLYKSNGKFDFKNKVGENVHYRNSIEEQLQELRDNRDYQNTRMGLGDAKLKDFNEKIEGAFEEKDKQDYLKNVFEDVDPADAKSYTTAVEKAIEGLEARIEGNAEIISTLNQHANRQSELINKSSQADVLDELQIKTGMKNRARLERDESINKIDKRITNDVSRVTALKEFLGKESGKFNAEDKGKLLKSLNDLAESPGTLDEKGKLVDQKKPLKDLKNWEEKGRTNTFNQRREELKNPSKEGGQVRPRV